ncbi:MAG: HIT domain-containing protein [Armatimonadota bacterium]|nr:HIT domain-containing protein [Armatimonadota bacterium]MCX7778396.1 HIT domain-containing protein [Armatimonadota bacterium]MDW8026265.1 HIT domain-containing protein [Armatimonadota bacterium]
MKKVHDIIWAPWRMQYVMTATSEAKGECIFCEKPSEQRDVENYIVARLKHTFVVLNIYPYNNGHLMVVPYRHVAWLSQLSEDELYELIFAVRLCEEALNELMHPDGFNMGLNLGRAAGAGIDQHLHIHIVPRWSGDTNFMPVIANTKVIPELLERTYARLRPWFETRGL